MRREVSFLRDILTASARIEAITAATSEESFLIDEVLPAAVLHHLTVIGEAISHLSPELWERHPEVPWRQIVAALQNCTRLFRLGPADPVGRGRGRHIQRNNQALTGIGHPSRV